jgi:hypothetical protein
MFRVGRAIRMNGRMVGLCDLVDSPISATSAGKDLLLFFLSLCFQTSYFSAKVLIFELFCGWEGIMGYGFCFFTLGFMCILG